MAVQAGIHQLEITQFLQCGLNILPDRRGEAEELQCRSGGLITAWEIIIAETAGARLQRGEARTMALWRRGE
jgi:hypothetical protein